MKFLLIVVNYLLDFILDREKILKDLHGKSFEQISDVLADAKLRHDSPFAVFNYKDGRIKDLIWQMKFNDNHFAAEIFGRFLADKIRRGDFDGPIENLILIPVPIHKKRRVERGYNQCEWLCEEIKKHIKINYRPEILVRNRYTEKQSWVNREKRQQNITGVFAVPDKFSSEIPGTKIILIDDVFTTGATINEARRTLLASGAAEVFFFTIAH